MNLDLKDLRAGGFFVLVGLAFGMEAYFRIPIGSPSRMGPGFFPILLSVTLTGLGLLICLSAFRSSSPRLAFVSWRGLLPVLGAPIVFGFTVRGLGFAPAVMLATALTALASPRTTLLGGALLGIGMTVFCVLVFNVGVGIPIDLIGPWLSR